MVVETGADGGVGGGGGKVNPCCRTMVLTLSRGPPGALCWSAVWATDGLISSKSNEPARTELPNIAAPSDAAAAIAHVHLRVMIPS